MEELSPKYDEYVFEAIRYAEGRLAPAAAAGFRDRMANDDMFRRVVEPVLEAWKAPPASAESIKEGWAALRQGLVARGHAMPSAEEWMATVREKLRERVERRREGE